MTSEEPIKIHRFNSDEIDDPGKTHKKTQEKQYSTNINAVEK